MKVFLSVGSQYNEEQRSFVKAFEAFLVENDCKRLTVDDGRADQPVFAARELMEEADAVIVLAFTRHLVPESIEKPGSNEEKVHVDRRYPTIWNQLEAAMGFGLKLPLLVIIEEGLYQEAMLKDRLEFRTVITKLDPALFRTDHFKSKFKHWMGRVEEKPYRKNSNIADMTVGEILAQLRPDQAWKVGASVFALIATIAAGAFWLGKNIP